jgi:hypothetical protein
MRTRLLAVLALAAVAWAVYAEYRVYRAVGLVYELVAIAESLMVWPEELAGYRKVCRSSGAELVAIQMMVEIKDGEIQPGPGRYMCARPGTVTPQQRRSEVIPIVFNSRPNS